MSELFIDSDQALREFCSELEGVAVIGLDTEFLREKTYYAQLCLLQVASEKGLACVDPLAINDLSPILDLIYDPRITKVMHSARQDLEIFFDLRGELPKPVFDTQLGATVLGYGDQLGYAGLVEKMQGVRLDKSHTRTNWSKRPLEEGQVRYALDDVRHLLAIYHAQLEKLSDLGRLSWLDEDFAQLVDLETYLPSEGNLWQKIRGANSLKGVQLAVLQYLAIWRENLAREKNKPKRWILKDELLVELARHRPASEEALNNIHGWETAHQRHNSAILDCVGQARALDSSQWPRRQNYVKLSMEQDAVVDFLMAVLRLRAAQQGVTPSVLGSRKDLELLLSAKDGPLLKGWRKGFIGTDLLRVLDGEISVQMQAGKLSMSER